MLTKLPSKIWVKTIIIILIQAFLILDISWAQGQSPVYSPCHADLLSPSLQINIPQFQTIISEMFSARLEIEKSKSEVLKEKMSDAAQGLEAKDPKIEKNAILFFLSLGAQPYVVHFLIEQANSSFLKQKKITDIFRQMGHPVVPLLHKAISQDSALTRYMKVRLADILGQIKDPRSLEPLVDLATKQIEKGEQDRIVLNALAEIIRLPELNDEERRKAADALLKTANDNSVKQWYRAECIRTLSEAGEFTIPWIIREFTLERVNKDMRIAAFQSLSQKKLKQKAVDYLVSKIAQKNTRNILWKAKVADRLDNLQEEHIARIYSNGASDLAHKLTEVLKFEKEEGKGYLLPTFEQFVNSKFFLQQVSASQVQILEERIEQLQRFKRYIGEDVFAAILKGRWGFDSLSNWMTIKDNVNREIFDIIGENKSFKEIIDKIIKSGKPELANNFNLLLINSKIELDTATLKDIINNICVNPTAFSPIIAGLIIALHLKRIRVSDEHFIQEALSNLLNSDIAPVYYLAQRLIKSVPYFFGEEMFNLPTEIRNLAAAIDESYEREHKLFHYLRLKIHRAPGPEDEDFAKAILEVLFSKENLEEAVIKKKDLEPAKEFIDIQHQQDILNSLDYDDMSTMAKIVCELKSLMPHTAKLDEVLKFPEEELQQLFSQLTLGTQIQRTAIMNLILLHQKLQQRYGIEDTVMEKRVENIDQAIPELVRQQDLLAAARQINQARREIKKSILEFEGEIKPDMDIEIKRHIFEDEFGFLSVAYYGTYEEYLLDNFNKERYLEEYANSRIFGGLKKQLKEITDSYKTEKHRNPIEDIDYVIEAIIVLIEHMEVTGLALKRMSNLKDVLKQENLTLQQVENISFALKEEVGCLYDYINFNFSGLIKDVAKSIGRSNINYTYIGGKPAQHHDDENFYQIVEEALEGHLLADEKTFYLLEDYVKYLGEIIKNSMLDDHDLVRKGIARPQQLVIRHNADRENISPSLIGTKALNLMDVRNNFEVNIPPFSVLTTDVNHQPELYKNGGTEAFRELVLDEILFLEQQTNKLFPFGKKTQQKYADKIKSSREKIGRPKGMLSISVRSGSLFSMPGMLETVLNVAFNDEIAENLLQEKEEGEWFILDIYRRFLSSYGSGVLGIDAEQFRIIIDRMKHDLGVTRIIHFDSENMRQLLDAFKNLIKQQKYDSRYDPLEGDPFELVINSIEAVFGSWDTKFAKDYRSAYRIFNGWGNTVMLQSMVFGQRGRDSGTAVMFSRELATKKPVITGAWKDTTQGVVLVGGETADFLALSKAQTQDPRRRTLEEERPALFREFSQISRILERFFQTPQDIEITREEGKDYLLQTRSASLQRGKLQHFDYTGKEEVIAYGEATSPGAVNGRVVSGLGDIESVKLRIKQLRAYMDAQGERDLGIIVLIGYVDPENALILIDKNVEGALTSAVGISAHATIAGRKENVALISGIPGLKFDYKQGWVMNGMPLIESLDTEGNFVRDGAVLAIDAHAPSKSQGSGKVMLGKVPIKEQKDAIDNLERILKKLPKNVQLARAIDVIAHEKLEVEGLEQLLLWINDEKKLEDTEFIELILKTNISQVIENMPQPDKILDLSTLSRVQKRMLDFTFYELLKLLKKQGFIKQFALSALSKEFFIARRTIEESI